MTEEEKKAIERLEEQLNFWKKQNIKNSDCEIILNLITKLQKENEVLTTALSKQSGDIGNYLVELQQKDKQIDLMAKAIDNYDTQLVINKFKDKEDIKQYFEKQAKRERRIDG